MELFAHYQSANMHQSRSLTVSKCVCAVNALLVGPWGQRKEKCFSAHRAGPRANVTSSLDKVQWSSPVKGSTTSKWTSINFHCFSRQQKKRPKQASKSEMTLDREGLWEMAENNDFLFKKMCWIFLKKSPQNIEVSISKKLRILGILLSKKKLSKRFRKLRKTVSKRFWFHWNLLEVFHFCGSKPRDLLFSIKPLWNYNNLSFLVVPRVLIPERLTHTHTRNLPQKQKRDEQVHLSETIAIARVEICCTFFQRAKPTWILWQAHFFLMWFGLVQAGLAWWWWW